MNTEAVDLNVIQPTNDLNELEDNYAKWNLMPMKFKILSNDKCQQQYGCTNIELYTKIKSRLMSIVSAEEDDPNNLTMKEDYTYNEDEYRTYYLLSISNKLQMSSPNIVIIDPNITDLTELENKYNKFLKLSPKFRLFSNDYSLQIWNYNVENMYRMLKSQLMTNNTDTDDNNSLVYDTESVVFESKFDKADVVIKDTIDFYTKVFASCNEATINKYKNFSMPSNVIFRVQYKPIQEFAKIYKEHSLPAIVPWNFKILPEGIDHMNYYKNVKEALESNNHDRLVELGWVPGVELNESNYKVAKNRIKRKLSFKKINYECGELIKNTIYVYLNNPLPESSDLDSLSKLDTENLYNKFAIRFVDSYYIISGIADSVITINKVDSLDDFGLIEEISINLDDEGYQKLREGVENYNEPINGNSTYRFIYRGTERLDRSNTTLIYYHLISILSVIAKYNISKTYNGFERLFYGYAKDLVEE